SLPVRLRVGAAGAPARAIDGDMLWTHFGISGPAALDASRHWLRHRLNGHDPWLTANLIRLPFEAAEAAWLERSARHPRQRIATLLGAFVPAAMADAICERAGVPAAAVAAELTREARRTLLHMLVDCPIPIADS